MLVYRAAIERLGKYQIREAVSGRECIEIASKFPVDLIILDYKLGDMSGNDVCREIASLEINSEVPIIISSMIDKEDVNNIVDCENVIKIVEKPYRIDDMYQDIEKALGS